jgi:hypothetical protein
MFIVPNAREMIKTTMRYPSGWLLVREREKEREKERERD